MIVVELCHCLERLLVDIQKLQKFKMKIYFIVSCNWNILETHTVMIFWTGNAISYPLKNAILFSNTKRLYIQCELRC